MVGVKRIVLSHHFMAILRVSQAGFSAVIECFDMRLGMLSCILQFIVKIYIMLVLLG